ncbi:MAG: hypothetical protein IRZ16_23370 [Myxococcaceae bacterium]|nr:hypothetical protein [Myxococcaceae bacterium]
MNGSFTTAAPLPRGIALCALSLVVLASSGCVTVYQPLVALQRPVVVDPRLPNFEHTRVLLRCIPGDDFPASDAEVLCRKLGTLFRNQGATVESEVPRNGRGSRLDDAAEKPDLVLDVRSRRLHYDDHPILTVLSALTLTLVPTIVDESFEQAVAIRDAGGMLLVNDVMQARFVRYSGVGVWSVNAVLDLLVRPDEDDLTGDTASEDFSRDFYAQVSQLMVNARIRSKVLHGFDEPAPDVLLPDLQLSSPP